jgi:putative Ig domain-containing protein
VKSLRALLFASLLAVMASSAWAQFVLGPSSLPTGSVGKQYDVQLTSTPVITSGEPLWTSTGSFPPGLLLDPNLGTISGIPTTAGVFTFTVLLTNGQQTGTKAFTIAVSGGTLGIAETTIPPGTLGVVYTSKLTPQGGVPPYAWAFSGGNANGLSIDALTGTISGTPAAAGSFPIQVTLSDSILGSISRIFTLAVIGIPAQTLPAGTPDVAYSATLQVVGAPGLPTWIVIGGSLPPGLTMSSGGVISGVPTTVGSYPFTVRVTELVVGSSATANFTIVIGTPVTITTTTLPDGLTGKAYTTTVAASGGQTPYTWTLASGAPAWLSIDSASGALTGTPPAAGTYSVTVIARSSGAAGGSGQSTLSIIVSDAIQITSPSLTITLGQALPASTQFTATGGTAPYTWSATALPTGLTLDATTGVLSGTPTAPGTFAINVTVKDARQQQASASPNLIVTTPGLTVTIGGLPPTSGPAAQPAATVAITSAFPTALTGTLNLTFASSVGGDDQLVRFANGTRTLAFTIAAGSTQGVFTGASNVLTGTVAGTITIKATLASGTTDVTPTPQPTQVITVNQTPPVITAVRVTNVTGGFNVIVTGYSTPRNMTSALFHFSATTGTNLAATDITVPVGPTFTNWYNNAASNAFGSQFTMTVPFTVTGATFPVSAVTVQLTNSVGNSTVSAPANPQ